MSEASPPTITMSAMFLAALLAVLAPASDTFPPALAGTWRATLKSPGGELPFELELSASGPSARIQNGAESIAVAPVSFENGELVLGFPQYAAQIRARPGADGRTLEGTWTKETRSEKPATLSLRAELGAAPRFRKEGASAAASVAGRWSVRFEKSADPAVAVFEAAGDALTGTFLTTTGDFRYLAGSFEGDHLRLSCFDGAHAFLFDARLKDGKLAGDFYSGDASHETWTAARDEKAALPDAWGLARWDDSFPLSLLTFPDVAGNERSLGEWLPSCRGLILVISGSWCPNCHDEMQDLAQLDRKMRANGLAIVGLSFEHSGDFAHAAELVRRSAIRHQAAYPMLVAGRSEARLSAQALPPLSGLRAFPTTIFFHRDGRVRGVHCGYSGPGTGAAHDALVREFEKVAEELVNEPVAPGSTIWPKIASGRWVDEPNGFVTTIFGNERDGRYSSNDPSYEADMQRIGGQLALRAQGSTVIFEDHPFHLDLESQALLDPFDFGHRLLAEERPSSGSLHVDANGFAVANASWAVAPERIVEALASANPRTRRDALFCAARAQREHKLAAPVDPLPFLDDADVLVRSSAAWLAGQQKRVEALPKLIENAGHGFAPLRRECAHALGRLGQKEARATLETLTRDLDPLVATHARAALAELAR